MKPQRKTFADSVTKFLEKPFKDGGIGPDAYGCAGFVWAFMKDRGKELVTQTGHLSLANYSYVYKYMTKEQIRDALIDVYELNGIEIPIGKQIAGDMLIVKDRLGNHFPAIYGGNKTIIASFLDAGVRTMKISNGMEIVKVRRV